MVLGIWKVAAKVSREHWANPKVISIRCKIFERDSRSISNEREFEFYCIVTRVF